MLPMDFMFRFPSSCLYFDVAFLTNILDNLNGFSFFHLFPVGHLAVPRFSLMVYCGSTYVQMVAWLTPYPSTEEGGERAPSPDGKPAAMLGPLSSSLTTIGIFYGIQEELAQYPKTGL